MLSGSLPLVWAHAQLVYDSPEESMTSPPNSYALTLLPCDAGSSPRLVWRTEEDGKAVEYDTEPARNDRQRAKVRLLSLLPLDKEL